MAPMQITLLLVVLCITHYIGRQLGNGRLTPLAHTIISYIITLQLAFGNSFIIFKYMRV